MNLFVGNLSRRMAEDDLRRLFEAYGSVASVRIVERPIARRFGFVLMADDRQARAALLALGQRMTVAPARSRLSGAYLMDVQDDYADTAR